MRLKPHEIDAIKTAAREAFGENVVVRLFGSRLDDTIRGGDIDLLLEVDQGHDTHRHEARFLDALFRRIDEQKVDLVLHVRGRAPSAFARLILPQAELLA